MFHHSILDCFSVLMHCISIHASYTFLCFNNSRISNKKLGACKIHLSHPSQVASAAIHFKEVVPLFIVALIVSVSFVFGLCFVKQYLVSFLVLQASRWGSENWLLYSNCLLPAM